MYSPEVLLKVGKVAEESLAECLDFPEASELVGSSEMVVAAEASAEAVEYLDFPGLVGSFESVAVAFVEVAGSFES